MLAALTRTISLAQMGIVALRTRLRVLEELGVVSPAGRCFEIAESVASALRAQGLDAKIVFGRVRNFASASWPHYWVVVTQNGERLVVDVSADQFGLPVVMLGREDKMDTHTITYESKP